MKSFVEVKKQNLEAFTKIIKEGQEQGIFKKDINILLIPPTIMGTIVHFQMNRPFFVTFLVISTEDAYENYIKHELTNHIKQTIKALLVHEN